ncbi:MAG: sulfurtransferase-like selenium metabolism protein YedF [Clostridia bacterium]|nr:MAG: sulfurtransferase-like selenium metabolism protein YedF [Clostridia bacterium]
MQVVDARGLACPQPVVATKKALETGAEDLVTIVDNEAARDNVVKFILSQGRRARVEERDGGYHIYISGQGDLEVPELATRVSAINTQVVLVTSDTLGHGEAELGRVLMQSFLGTLAESEALPQSLTFINSGVKLVCEGSPVLDSLMRLEQGGVEISACGTCLDYYHLKEKLCVGRVTNMYAIVTSLLTASKVTTL